MITIQRETGGAIEGTLNELTITSSPNLPKKIQNLIDDLWTGHAPSTL